MKKFWLLFTCVVLAAGAARAQDAYPNKPIQLIVPFPPGGAADQPARLLAQALGNVWKQPAVVMTRSGAGGAVGMQVVANAAPDGYTLVATNPALLILPEADHMFGRKPIIERSQFTPVALLVADPVVLVVKADAPWKTYQDFVADAKAHPDNFTYGSSGAYSASHLPIEMLANSAGIKLRHISYSGGGPAILAVLGGQVAATASSPAAVGPQIKAGALRALVTTGNKRVAALPDVPTALELGYKDAEFYIWIGLFAPAKTPEATVQAIRAGINRAVTEEGGFVQTMAKLGAPTDYRDAPAFNDFLNKDYERIKATVQKIGKVD
ncbi:MAG TPA: tripartite tricarboxylate transporter substrate binding protein [Burkholderiales bacterium]|jgi:tripartite-type tricarboxylate transporter receptor subunit TctC|nr:tripartite tricarboxylate transporter substrate binding protein [Burkholderiales bacterium]